MKTVLITGGSKGIGLEFAKQYAEKGWHVFAASRDPGQSPDLQTLARENSDRVILHPLDVSNEKSRKSLFQFVSERADTLDLLINNAGIAAGDERSAPRFGDWHTEDFNKVFQVNAIGPLLMAEKFQPLMTKAANPIIANISSDNGSIALRTTGGNHSYCASKAALNMISKGLAVGFMGFGIIVVALHPGWVRTPMTVDENAPLEPSESIGGMIKVIESLQVKDSGRFIDWRGREVPW
jgi:NAD(P)-dependent dehydrogenase (short-subunit alcohol dehydrogenase family)